MMRIHKEGYKIIINSFVILAISAAPFFIFSTNKTVHYTAAITASLLFILIVRFFREPEREITDLEPGTVTSPADGTIVIIKKVFEPEYLKCDCMQVSIFMSIFNAHVNWSPINGKVEYSKYHKGKYLVAMHPKSSVKNERTSVAITTPEGKTILTRQIAGYIARRIVCYTKEKETIKAGNQIGFIKFGSRVDLFLPLDSQIKVKKGDKVRGCTTTIAKI